MPKPDPELLPTRRPRCPECQMRMVSTAVADAADGFEDRTFACAKCGHVETRRMLADPLASPAPVAWSNAGLEPPQ
jgi:transcription elongation factor Elf1